MKERITISLNEESVKFLDSLIGKENLQNRSQAVEYIVNKHAAVFSKPKAILLGGTNLDLKSLQFNLKKLEQAQVQELILAGGKNNEVLSREIISKNPFFYKNHLFLKEDKKLGTAGAIKLAENNFDSAFFVIFLDTLCEINFGKMLEIHRNSRKLCTMAVTLTKKKAEMLDEIRVKDNTIIKFEYKSSKPSNLQGAGVFIFEPKALDYFPTKGQLEKEVLPKLAEKKQIEMYFFDDFWLHSD